MTEQLPKDGRTYRIWSVVEDLILERYDQLADEIDAVVDTIMAETDAVDDLTERGEGPLTTLKRVPGEDGDGVDLGDIREQLETVARERRDRLVWWRQSRYEDDVTEQIDREAVETIADTLPAEGGV